jgi:hypothetical protein
MVITEGKDEVYLKFGDTDDIDARRASYYSHNPIVQFHELAFHGRADLDVSPGKVMQRIVDKLTEAECPRKRDVDAWCWLPSGNKASEWFEVTPRFLKMTKRQLLQARVLTTQVVQDWILCLLKKSDRQFLEFYEYLRKDVRDNTGFDVGGAP